VFVIFRQPVNYTTGIIVESSDYCGVHAGICTTFLKSTVTFE